MREAGVAERIDVEGYVHGGTLVSFGDTMFRVDFTKQAGHHVTVYGQTEVPRDLCEAREATNGKIQYCVRNHIKLDVRAA